MPNRAPWRGFSLRIRREMSVSDRPALVFLVLLTLSCTLGGIVYPDYIPSTVLLLPMFIGSLWLGPRSLPWFIVFVCACFCVLLVDQPTVSLRAIGRAVVTFAIALLIMATSFRRSRLGVSGPLGESMFVDLRDRLRAFGELPELPGGWHAETAVESAYGQSFSGDFVVATRSPDGRWFEVVLVDVSGKGVQAGTRSLLLSGALGGLLGEQEPNRFLTAANNYLLRQNWDEGFATAVHVSIDLATGDYTIGSAGHPPAVQFNNGSGRWEVLGEAAGPLLGVIDDATYIRSYRRLGRGDALVLYTDGVVESRFRDLTVGVDRMLGAAERLVRGGFAGGAKRLCASARAGETDDRAVVMIWRD